MARRIAAGEIGAVRHIEGNFSGPPSYQTEPGNWRSNQVESPGGSMTARGVHVLDSMVNIAGPVATRVRLQRAAAARHRRRRHHRLPAALCRRRDRHARDAARGEPFYRIHAFGSQGALEMRGETELNCHRSRRQTERLRFDAVDKERAELEAFADAVAGGVKFVIAPEAIVNVVAATEAVVESARSGEGGGDRISSTRHSGAPRMRR